MNWRRARPIILLSSAVLLAMLSAWTSTVVGVNYCGEGVGRFEVACFWFVETSLPVYDGVVRPILFFGLVPALIVSSVWTVHRRIGRAMSVAFGVVAVSVAVLPRLVYSLMFVGPALPGLSRSVLLMGSLQYVVFVWPQRAFFILYKNATPGGPLVPWDWNQFVPLAFWTLATLGFGIVAQRVKSMLVLFPLAMTFVVAVVLVVGQLAPILGYRIRIEIP